jgi:drug/metabolite transporter (DMT)-like permease
MTHLVSKSILSNIITRKGKKVNHLKAITIKRNFVFFILLLESITFGLSFLGMKAALLALEPMEVIACRWTIAFCAYLFLILTGMIKVKINKRNRKNVILIAFLQPCCYSICEILGVDLVSVSESAILLALLPVFVTLITICVYKERPGGLSVISMLLAFAGVIVIFMFGKATALSGNIVGYVLLLTTAVIGAVFSVGSNKMFAECAFREITFMMTLEGAFFFNLILVLQGKNPFSGYLACVSSSHTLLAILFLGIGCSVLAMYAYNYVLSRLPATDGCHTY